MVGAGWASMVENVIDDDGCRNANEVGHQSVAGSIAETLDTYRAEIDGKDIHCGVGRALDGGSHVSDEGVNAVGLEDIEHHGTSSCTIEWFEQGTRQGSAEIGINAYVAETPTKTIGDIKQGTAFAEEADAHEKGHLVRNDGHDGVESVFSAIDECFENRNLLLDAY